MAERQTTIGCTMIYNNLPHTTATSKDWATCSLLNTGERMCFERVSSSCSTLEIRDDTIATNPVLSHTCRTDWDVITTNRTHTWLNVETKYRKFCVYLPNHWFNRFLFCYVCVCYVWFLLYATSGPIVISVWFLQYATSGPLVILLWFLLYATSGPTVISLWFLAIQCMQLTFNVTREGQKQWRPYNVWYERQRVV